MASRMKELMKKYGFVGLGVHVSISAASVAGLYAAVKSNVDVASLFHKFGLPGIPQETNPQISPQNHNFDNPGPESTVLTDDYQEVKKRNRTAEIAASSGGALMMALLLNKALIPVRVPITLVLTPPIARFLARHQIVKNAAL